MLKQVVKRAAHELIGRAAPARWRRLPGPELVVLTYHRVLPDGHPDRLHEQPGMYVRPGTFAMHLAVLKEHFELVQLDDWLAARSTGRPLPRLACAITFDDGWRDNYDHAFPVLKQARAPATIFLVSGLIGGNYSFWPNRLARQLARTDRPARLEGWPAELRDRLAAAGLARNAIAGPLAAEAIDRAIVACKALSDAQMHDLLDRLPVLPSRSAGRDLLNAHEVQEMGASGLVRFGSHTRRHTRLRADVPAEVLADEIAGSAEELERLTGHRPRLFCYPNGDSTPAALQVVKANYAGAAATAHGWNAASLDPFMIRRVGMHEDVSCRTRGFIARLEMAR